MPEAKTVERAFFQVERSEDKIEVHFNPETLQYAITNNMANQGSGNATKQYVSDSTAKLTMDLIFDSTGTGEDVRLKTIKIAKFMNPSRGEDEKVPPVVNFEWGLYKFTGTFDSYKETLDYFSSDGVPLRAAINISMSSQDKVFEADSTDREAAEGGNAGMPNNSVPATAGEGKGVTDLATKAGNPSAAKAIASANGLESMRFPGAASLELNASVSLQGAAGFNTSGVSANVGAFSGLQSSAGGASASLKLNRFLKADVSAGLGIDSASIGPGGSSGLQGSASLKADVGVAGALQGRIEFDGA